MRAETIVAAAKSRGILPGSPKSGRGQAVETAAAVAERVTGPLVEALEDDHPELAAKVQTVSDGAVSAARGAAGAALSPAQTAVEAAAVVATVAAEETIVRSYESMSRAIDKRVDIGAPDGTRSETSRRFARSRSAKLTRKEVERLLETAEERRKEREDATREAAAVISALDDSVVDAEPFLWELLSCPYPVVRQAAAVKIFRIGAPGLRAAALAEGPL